MKINVLFRQTGETGSGLVITIVMMAIALATLAAAMSWSASTTRLNERAAQYARSLAAAEANTEMVIAQIVRDYRNGGATYVRDNTNTYQQLALTNASIWKGWEVSDSGRNARKTFVDVGSITNFVELDSNYSGLRGFVCPVNVVSNARLTNTVQNVVATVSQQIQLTRIPIFQFAIFSSDDMEISCGQPFKITGKVHSNKMLYVEPDDELTFESDVTAVGDILFQRHPLDDRTPPSGVVTYRKRKEAHVPALTLPIGTNNSPLAIREIIQPPPAGEDVNSHMGRQRYYNLSDLIITVTGGSTGATVTASTGIPITPNKTIPNVHLQKFAYVNTNFFDWREMKRVRPLDLNIGELVSWSGTNGSWFGNRNISSIYVWDKRTMASNELAAVRVRNGTNLPAGGLTVATARPLYVLGHYNQKNIANLGTTNTTTTVPASLIADAITVLSGSWLDSASSNSVSLRVATPTTVNAAFLTGTVDTTLGSYSGGMENFPRFLETWGSAAPFTYNGSMVKMFPSQYATNAWGSDNTYSPPARNWAYDLNFNDGTKLPPLTPSVQRVMRAQWAALAPYETTNTTAAF